jgi:hypothetical protein
MKAVAARPLLVVSAATVASVALLVALLSRRGPDLAPRRSSVMELDEPGPTVRPPG